MMEFPYSYRKHQKDIIKLVESTLNDGHLVLQSGTGSGKTVCALYPSVKLALAESKKILYLVRTNSQQRQVILELRKIGGAFGMGFQGRLSTCLAARNDPHLREGSPDDLMRFCSHKKGKTVRGEKGGCEYYSNLLNADFEHIESWARRELPTMEQFFERCKRLGVCPYETSKLLILSAQVIACPYIYFFGPGIRSIFLEWMNMDVRNIILIVDEAHNLPEYAREMRSARLSLYSIRLVVRELEKFGDVKVLGNIRIKHFCNVLTDVILGMAAEYGEEEDGLLPPSQLEEDLMHRLKLNSVQLKGLFRNLMDYGEVIREKRKQRGKLPRSFTFSLGASLAYWLSMDASEYVKLVNVGDVIGVEGYCLDPSHVGEMVSECQASIHMSGTLEPLRQYRDTLGLPMSTVLARFPSPFPPEKRRVMYTDDVTTRYEEVRKNENLIPHLKSHVARMLRGVSRSTVVFFPSHDLLEEFLDLRLEVPRRILAERRGSTHDELMNTVDRFKTGSGVLYAVMGGRVSEGLDFPDKELELAVLVGIPYPKPTAKQRALLQYCDLKFGKGWDYAVKAPATRKLLQSIGRLIRNENDVGVALILDKRAKTFSSKIEDLVLVDDPVREAERFFEQSQLLSDNTCDTELLARPH